MNRGKAMKNPQTRVAKERGRGGRKKVRLRVRVSMGGSESAGRRMVKAKVTR